MIPLKDDVRGTSFPFMNLTIIVVNTLVFLYEFFLPSDAQDAFLLNFAVIPARLISPQYVDWYTVLTSQFLHGGWLHLGSNMLALFIFGDNVEDQVGHFKYLLFYLVCGVAASMLHVAVEPGSRIPALGASGAIAGVLAAYMVMFPRAHVRTFIPIFIIPWIISVPAVLWALGWFVSQVVSGVAALSSAESTGGVGFWAHVGGFVAGFILAFPLRGLNARTLA